MAQENTASQQIYDLLVTKDFDPKSLDNMGKPTVNPSEADLFSFNFTANGNEYGTVVVLINGDNDLEVYYGDNLGKGMDPGDKGDWYDFLAMLRQTAKRNLLTFSLNNMNKLKYQMATMADLSENLILEAWKAQGKSKSYSNQPGKAKVVIQHSRAIGEGEQRFRNIASLFVENSQGERFRMPFESIAGAKAMARHVSEGGTPYDAFGQYISETINEIKTLGKFVRASRSNAFAQNEQALDIVEDAVKHYSDLKRKAKKMIGKRGYKEIFSNYDPAIATELDETIESVREVFVNSAVDSRIEEALPILAKIKESTMKEANQFENWTNQIMEGTWALPETEEDMARLQELMTKPLPCGPDGEYATEQLYDLIGDDVLFDDIYELSQKDPDSDCREIVKARAQELGVEIDIEVGESVNEDVSIGDHVKVKGQDIEGKVIADYGNMVVIRDDDAETDDDELEFRKSDLEVSKRINENPTDQETASSYQAGQADAAAGKERSMAMNLGGEKAAMKQTAGGQDIEEGYGDKIIFKGKEIDEDTIEYDMQDFDDLIFVLEDGVKYTDGTPVADEDYNDLHEEYDLIEWVRIDYMDRVAPQYEGMDSFVNPNDQDGTDNEKPVGKMAQDDMDDEDMTEDRLPREELDIDDDEMRDFMSADELRKELIDDLNHLYDQASTNDFTDSDHIIDEMGDYFKDMHVNADDEVLEVYQMARDLVDAEPAEVIHFTERGIKALGGIIEDAAMSDMRRLSGQVVEKKHVKKETQDVDTGKEALKAERDPMLERILNLAGR